MSHGKPNLESSDFEPVCEDAPYRHYKPGEYQALCVAAKIYRDPRFKRWVCRLKFRLFPEGGQVVGFLNLGAGKKPRAERGSEYRRAWIIANGGEAPRKRQIMSPRMFEKKIFLVRIGDISRRHDRREHSEGEIYSVIKEILKRIWP